MNLPQCSCVHDHIHPAPPELHLSSKQRSSEQEKYWLRDTIKQDSFPSKLSVTLVPQEYTASESPRR